MAADTSLLAPAIMAAVLVIRTALREFRRPGSAREEWAFATNRRAMTAGAAAAAAVVLLGWHQSGPAAAAWALLVGALTGHLFHRDRNRS